MLGQREAKRCAPGPRPHPEAAYLKAFLISVCEEKCSMIQLSVSLVEHPLLVLEVGFHLALDLAYLHGFDVRRTVPSDCWLREKLHQLDPILTI